MYYLSRNASVYHIVDESIARGTSHTLCGLACDRVGLFSKPPTFHRLCKRCAKWLPREEKPDA